MATTTAPAVSPIRRDGDDITDHDLVARVRAGDDRAFERLYRRYHRRIAAYIQGMVHDHARAEDITQDVFMSALRRMRDTDRPIAFKPWIYEIAKNACIDQFRRSKRAEEVSYDAEDGGLGSADYGKLVTKDPGPDVAVENKQSLDHLRGAFGGLSETHHEILVMRELEGLSYREIGERLGMTRPAVESTLFRARRRLTEEYEQLVTGERCQRVQGIIATATAGGLGARDKRRLARHVSYCQPCLRHARMAGMSGEDLALTPLRQKIAGFLPIPAFLKAKLGGGEADVSQVAMWSAHASNVDPGVMSSWSKAAATAATVVVAGIGAGAATQPSGDASALDGRGFFEQRVGERGSSKGGEREDPLQPVSSASGGSAAGPAAPIATAGAGTQRDAAASGRAGAAKTTAGRKGSSGGSGSGSSSSSGGAGGASDGGSSPSSSSGAAKSKPSGEAADSQPDLTETPERVTQTANDQAGSLGGTVDKVTEPVRSTVQNLLPPSNTTTPPAPTPQPSAPAPQDPVGGILNGVDKTVDGVTSAVDNLVGGLTGQK